MPELAHLNVAVSSTGFEKVEGELKQTASAFSRAQATVISFNQALDLVRRVTTPVINVFQQAVAAASEQEDAVAALTAQLQIQGRYSAEFVRGLQDQASALQQTTVFADEVVNSVQAMLATFPRVSNEVLPRATEVVLDFATAMGRDAVGSAQALGRALQDPAEALRVLQQAGVRFSDDQKKVLEHLVATGQSAKAQAFLLDELSTRMGGRAAAAAQTFSGQMKQLNNFLGDFLEEIGNVVVKSDALRAGFTLVKDELIKLTEETVNYVNANREVIESGIDDFFARLPAHIEEGKKALGDIATVGGAISELQDVPMIKALIDSMPSLKSTAQEIHLISVGLTALSQSAQGQAAFWSDLTAAVKRFNAEIAKTPNDFSAYSRAWDAFNTNFRQVQQQREKITEATSPFPQGAKPERPIDVAVRPPPAAVPDADAIKKAAKAAEEAAEAQKKYNEQMRESGAELTAMLDPMEAYRQGVVKIDELLHAGTIGAKTYEEQISSLRSELAQKLTTDFFDKPAVDAYDAAIKALKIDLDAGVITMQQFAAANITLTESLERGTGLVAKAQALKAAILSPYDALIERLKEIKQLSETEGLGITPEMARKGVVDAVKAFQDLGNQADKTLSNIESAVEDVGRATADAFVEMGRTGEFAFEDLLAAFRDDLIRLFSEELFINPIVNSIKEAIRKAKAVAATEKVVGEALTESGVGGNAGDISRRAAEDATQPWADAAGKTESAFTEMVGTVEELFAGMVGNVGAALTGLFAGLFGGGGDGGPTWAGFGKALLGGAIGGLVSGVAGQVQGAFSGSTTSGQSTGPPPGGAGSTGFSGDPSATSGGSTDFSGFNWGEGQWSQGFSQTAAPPPVMPPGAPRGSLIGRAPVSGSGYGAQTVINVPTTIPVQALDSRQAATVIQENMPLIETGIRRSIERGGQMAAAVRRRRG